MKAVAAAIAEGFSQARGTHAAQPAAARLGLAAFLALAAWDLARHAFSAGGTLVDLVNFAVHEGGHVVFGFLGELPHFLGGSSMQLAIPGAALAHFWQRQAYYSTSIAAVWLGENCFEVGRYMMDAGPRRIPLFHPAMTHDWWWIFRKLHLMWASKPLGALMFAAGVAVGLAGVALAVLTLLRAPVTGLPRPPGAGAGRATIPRPPAAARPQPPPR